MTLHEFTPQLKKYIAARLKDQNDHVTVTGIPTEDDSAEIMISTSYALFRVFRPIYQMVFQPCLYREPPNPGEGFQMGSDRPVETDRQIQQWIHLKNNCRNPAHLTPYFLDTPANKGRGATQLRLLWADPLTIWVDTGILNTVDARWGEIKAAASDLDPIHFQGTNSEAIFLPWRRWSDRERTDNPLFIQEAALAKAWYERQAQTA